MPSRKEQLEVWTGFPAAMEKYGFPDIRGSLEYRLSKLEREWEAHLRTHTAQQQDPALSELYGRCAITEAEEAEQQSALAEMGRGGEGAIPAMEVQGHIVCPSCRTGTFTLSATNDPRIWTVRCVRNSHFVNYVTYPGRNQ